MSAKTILLDWMRTRGHERDFAWLASQIHTGHAAQTLRFVAYGYRVATWDMAFALEALTGISAHDIRAIGTNNQGAA